MGYSRSEVESITQMKMRAIYFPVSDVLHIGILQKRKKKKKKEKKRKKKEKKRKRKIRKKRKERKRKKRKPSLFASSSSLRKFENPMTLLYDCLFGFC